MHPQDSGTFTDLDKFRSLMGVARKDIVLSQGWDEQQLRRWRPSSVAGAVQTLPVLRYDTVDGRNVNIIDPAAIRAAITAGIDGTPVTTATPARHPARCAGHHGGQCRRHLRSGRADRGRADQKGYPVEQTRDREDVEPTETVVQYGPGGDGPRRKSLSCWAFRHHPSRHRCRPVRSRSSSDRTSCPSDALTDTRQPGGEPNRPEPTATPEPDAGPPIDGDGIVCVD